MTGIPSFTLALAADAQHLAELRLSVPTWQRHKSWLFDCPAIMAFDPLSVEQDEAIEFMSKRWRVWATVPADATIADRRERMLTAFAITIPPAIALSQYILKIDSDCIATGPGEPQCDWFDGMPAIIAPAWNYTRPAAMLDELDLWAQTIPDLRRNPPPLRTVIGDKAKHRRIISYCMFYRTDWAKWAAGICEDGRLPVPSQDTAHWYMAARHGDSVRTINARSWGFEHVHAKRLQSACEMAMSS